MKKNETTETASGTLQTVISTIDLLTNSFLEVWEPTETVTTDTELKTTMDIAEEMEPVFQVEPGILASALATAGFKIHYTGEGFFWMLKKR